MKWVTAGRVEQRRSAQAALDGHDRRGIHFLGPAGVGKTHLAREITETARRHGMTTLWSTATPAAKPIPFGAFAHLLPSRDSNAPTVDTLRGTARSILDLAEGGRLVFTVDDAHLLDDASATLVRVLANSAACFVVLASYVTEQMPDMVRRLVRDFDLEQIELDDFSRSDADAVVTATLPGRIAPLTLAEVWRLTQGNPHLLREVITRGVSHKAIRNEEGTWLVADTLAAVPGLDRVVASRIGSLTRDEREVVDLLAIGGQIGLGLLETLVDLETIETLERRRILTVADDELRHEVRLAYPLYADVLSLSLPRTRIRPLARRLAETLATTGARRQGDTTRLAKWRLEGGGGDDSDVFCRAARRALARFDGDLAARLARSAMATGGGFEAQLILGEALIDAGRTRAAAKALDQAEATATTDVQRTRAAISQCRRVLVAAGNATAALDILERVSGKLSSPDCQEEVFAERALVLADQGDYGSVAEVSTRHSDRSDRGKRAELAVLRVTAWAHLLSGRLDLSLDAIDDGLEIATDLREELPRMDLRLRRSRIHALLLLGRLHDAEREARESHRRAIDENVSSLTSAWATILGQVLLERGHAARARIVLAAAAGDLRRRDPLGLATDVDLLRAQAALMLGDVEASRRLLPDADHSVARRDESCRWDARVRFWQAVQDGHLSRAVEMEPWRSALDAPTATVLDAAILHDAVRVGRAEIVADVLGDLAGRVQGRLVATMAAHAEASASKDALRLEETAKEFEELGADLLGAEAATQAAALHRRQGSIEEARLARAAAGALARRCGLVVTPALEATPPVLTPREQEIADLVGLGLSSHTVANRLGVSVRTVDNHLYRVYKKLSIRSRAELADVMPQVDA